MHFLFPILALLMLAGAARKGAKPKQAENQALDAAEAAAVTASAEGEPIEEAEIDAFETYLLNGGTDIYGFSKEVSLDPNQSNPTIERWAAMSPKQIAEELTLETELSPEDIAVVVGNYLIGAKRPERLAGLSYVGGKSAKKRYLFKILIGGSLGLLLGPEILLYTLVYQTTYEGLRFANIKNMADRLITKARNEGADFIVLPENTPRNDNNIIDLVERLQNAGFEVRFTGPSVELSKAPVGGLGDRFSNFGEGIADVTRKAGHGIAKGAKATGRGIEKGAKATGRGARRGAESAMDFHEENVDRRQDRRLDRRVRIAKQVVKNLSAFQDAMQEEGSISGFKSRC